MAVRAAEVDYARSTNAFPMDKEPEPVFVDLDLDFSKSTGAYPMYDDRNAAEVRAEHLSAPVDAGFTTPGPTSSGFPDVVEGQRDELGLTADPTGESDVGYQARPSTIVVPGADGVDRSLVYEGGYLVEPGAEEDQEAVVVDLESDAAVVVPEPDDEVSSKTLDAKTEVEAKVVEAPTAKQPRGRTRASGK